MASVPELVAATKRMKAKLASHVGWPLAAIKAIEGQGITNKADVTRLTREIMREIRPKRTSKPVSQPSH